MNVLFVVPGDEEQASTRLRVLNLIPYLEEEGISCETISLEQIRTWLPDSSPLSKVVFAFKVLIAAPQYDVVYIQKTLLPPIYTKILTKMTRELVYDFDDAIYATPAWGEETKTSREKLNQMISGASVVVAGSPVLAEYAVNHTDQDCIRCLPTSIPKEQYESYWGRTTITGQEVTIGWIGNTQNLRYLTTIEGSLRQVLEEHDDVSMNVITAEDPNISPLADCEDVHYREWSLESELDYLSEADIVIRPLLDDEWTRGKGGFTSVVQSMALGIPVVVTPVRYLTDIVTHGESGFYAKTDEEWVSYLRRLIEKPRTRNEMGEKARKSVNEKGYWTSNRADDIMEIFNSIV